MFKKKKGVAVYEINEIFSIIAIWKSITYRYFSQTIKF